MHGRIPRRLLSLAAAAALFAATVGQSLLTGSARAADANASAAQAEAALVEGRSLLRRNRAAEALPRLESALALFTQAGDTSGAAAARDQIGDIFQRYGQYQTALDNYRGAYDAFCGRREQANANLMLVKIGETGYLAGDTEAARAAFARMNQCGAGSNAAATPVANGDNRSRGAAAFIPAGAALSLASCPAFSPGDDNNNNNKSNDAANNTPPNEPTLGHGPTARNPSVRMDLRVVDQDGNPVKGVKAKLESERGAGGLLCDCTHFTDAAGKVLMDPIHLTRTLKLTLQAKGFDPLQVSVDPSKLNQPFRVAMQAKGAAQQAANAASQAKGATQQAGNAPANPASCFDLYRFFVAYGFGELGAARADYDSNNLTAARAHYENVLGVSDEKSPAGSLSAARLFRAVARTSLGDIAQREGRFGEAARLYAQAIEAARKDNRLELAWAAQRGLGKSLWAAAAQGGDAAATARAREDALKAFRDALATVETLFAGSPRADEARTNFLASTRDLYDDAISAFAASALDAAGPAPDAAASGRASLAHAETAADSRPLTGRALAYAAEAFRAAEQGRARSLLDLIGESRAEITAGVPADLLARRADNAARQQEIADALRGVRSPGAATPQDTVAKLEAELERLGSEYNALENRIRVASPRYSALVRTQPLTLEEVQRQVLDEGTVLLEYFLGSTRSHLFVVTKTGLALHRLPARAAIDAQVVELRNQLVPAGARRAIIGVDADAQRGLAEELKSATAGRGLVLGGPAVAPQVVKAYADAAHALYNTAVAPAAGALGSKRLVVAADGALSFVPFEALVTAPGGADYASLNYLVKTNEVIYVPSASVVAAVRQAQAAASARTPGGGVLVVADPVFEAGDARAAGKNVKPRDEAARRAVLQSALGDVTSLKLPNLRLVRLAGTRSEAEQIAALARDGGGAADVWLDLDASEANVRTRALDGYRVLHFATHGLLDTERPQFTGLALSVAGDGADDGFLRVDEVFNLRLGSPLVVLSACETGLGRERRGEGVIGLTRAFMYAGAPTVGVSLWSVADRSTAELMPDFYKRYLASQSHSPAAAMRAAQQQMIAGKKYSAPFYWAPFVLVGDWR
ncbi:MAG TPA: CHAT domain-containing tetratricopeptide repeat protein [Pyrinomonadaceae bacterium]|jgi:CHAT domain-containing protein|nr:CHAT domain-containing tetratricopeptide repeat protein [Pyrinomonadaceae bacterium]